MQVENVEKTMSLNTIIIVVNLRSNLHCIATKSKVFDFLKLFEQFWQLEDILLVGFKPKDIKYNIIA